MVKRALIAMLVAGVAGSAASAPPASAAPARKIRFAMIDHRKFGARYYVEAVKRFKADVEAKTDGRLSVELVDLAEWGTIKREGAQIAAEKLASGELEMANLRADTIARLYEHRLTVFDMPYLIRDDKHANRIVEGSVGRRLAERLPEHGLTSLAYTYSGGFRVVAGNRPATPASLHGMKVAMTNIPAEIDQYKAWGADALPTGKEDFMDVVDAGKAEAVELTWNCFDGTPGMPRKLRVVTEMDNNFYVTMMLANSKFLASLPEGDRAIVVAAAEEAAAFERGVTLSGNAKIRDNFVKSGGTVVVLSDAEREVLAKASEPVRRKYAEVVGADIVKAVEDEGRPDRAASRTPADRGVRVASRP